MSGRSWKFESSHGHEKQKSVNSRFFFALPLPFSCFCFPHTTTGCPSLSSKKVTTTQTTKTTFLSYSKKCCPRLSLVVVKKNTTTQTTKTTFLSYSKNVIQGCPSLSSKKHDNIDNKDNISFLFQKCCSRLSLVVVKKIIFS